MTRNLKLYFEFLFVSPIFIISSSVFFFFPVGGSGSEDHASDANLQDLEAGSSLDRPQSLRLHTETVLPAGLTAATACVNKPIAFFIHS